MIGPSNPVASIGPILAVPGMREALRAAPAPVVAVSPFVGGAGAQGPDAGVLRARRDRADRPRASPDAYGGLLDGIVADEPVTGLPSLVTDTLMDTPGRRARVAERTLEFAASLRG